MKRKHSINLISGHEKYTYTYRYHPTDVPYSKSWMVEHDDYVQRKLEKGRFVQAYCQICHVDGRLEDVVPQPMIKKRKKGGLKRHIDILVCGDCIHLLEQRNDIQARCFLDECSITLRKDLSLTDLIN